LCEHRQGVDSGAKGILDLRTLKRHHALLVDALHGAARRVEPRAQVRNLCAFGVLFQQVDHDREAAFDLRAALEGLATLGQERVRLARAVRALEAATWLVLGTVRRLG
jgi:hypothetical protein